MRCCAGSGAGSNFSRGCLSSRLGFSEIGDFARNGARARRGVGVQFLSANVPLAAVLWSGGISFAGVMAFIFADLIVLPIVVAYSKYYGWAFALRITALMFVTMALAALAIDGLFTAADLIPTDRPSTDEVFGSVELNYKAALNAVALVVFVALMYLSVRRDAAEEEA